MFFTIFSIIFQQFINNGKKTNYFLCSQSFMVIVFVSKYW